MDWLITRWRPISLRADDAVLDTAATRVAATTRVVATTRAVVRDFE